jgi:hypothetical protein
LGRFGGEHPVGEIQNQPLQLAFNSSLKVDFQGSRVTSDDGLVLVRELDERLRFSELIEQQLTDLRGKNTQLYSPSQFVHRPNNIESMQIRSTNTERN